MKSNILAIVFLTLTSVARAASISPDQPPAGTCAYRQPGIKICSVLKDGQGVFDVFLAPPAYMLVRFEDPIKSFIVPDQRYFQSGKQENTATVILLHKNLPEGRWQATFTSGALTVTLNIHPGSETKTDAQVTIVDPFRSERKAQVADIDKRVEERTRSAIEETLLRGLAHSGGDCDLVRDARGRTIDRNSELIVIRAKRVVCIDQRRYLTFSVQNKSADPFSVKRVRIWNGAEELTSKYEMAKRTIEPVNEVTGVVSLGSIKTSRNIRILVEEADSRRNVELRDIELPR